MNDKRIANLKKWANTGECVFVSSYALSVGIGLHAISLPLTLPEKGILLQAVIEAIRARDWYYDLTDDDQGGHLAKGRKI